ncbi:MAG TPA: FtsQ-type POTRA domain-containing protein [Blastococcus sp.]|nr:FtsQ-type POTRA domain-containing protein [Blastococcus sp.]
MSRTGTTTRDRRAGTRRPAERRGPSVVSSLAGRRGARRRRPMSRLLRAALLVVVLGAVAGVLWAGPLLAVRTVQVDGAASLPAAQVRQAAGIAEGTPLLRVDVAAAEARVARLPQIASVTVTRGWPDRVVITVAERVPVAVVGSPGNRELVDATGMLFDTITGSLPPGVVPIEVAHPGPGDRATMAALAAVTGLPRSLRPRVKAVSATDAGEVSLALDDGVLVRWGTGERSPAKGAALAGLLQQIDAGSLDPAKTIDVSTPDAVVLR